MFRKKDVFCTVILVLFIISSLCYANRSHGAERGPNVLLVTIDTLRADHLGCCGYKAIKTPHIDSLAKEGALFTNAYSPVPLTLPSHTSILTGQYPIRHGVQNNGTFILPESACTLAEVLHESGYKTGAVVSACVLASHLGLNQGFDYYDDHFKKNTETLTHDFLNTRSGGDVTATAKKWLQQNHEGPFFLWAHYFDPHSPYEPPSPYDQEYKEMPYDGEIAYTDQCVGDLIKAMRGLIPSEDTFVIIVGDHGEGLGEHNESSHGVFIYNSTLKVPLIVSCPRLIPKGQEVSCLVRTIDIMPTIEELLGINVNKDVVQGKSLVPLLKGGEKDLKLDLYCESLYPEFNFNWAPLEGIITSDGWKYIHAPKPELYQLKADPHETKNLVSADLVKAASLREGYEHLKKEVSSPSISQERAAPVTITLEEREKLRSLGYIGNSVSIDERGDAPLPDPKDKANLLSKIISAQDLEVQGNFAQAIQLYEEVLKDEPENKMVLFNLGMAHNNMDEPKKALEKMQKVADLDPQKFDCHYILGKLYDTLAMPEQAINAYKRALNLNPMVAEVHNSLGMIYLKTNQLDLAIAEFELVKSLSKDPALTSSALGNIGGIYIRKGKLEDALKNFKESIDKDQLNHDAYISLADTYHQLGEIDQSIKEWQEVVRLWPDDYIASYRLAQLCLDTDKPAQAISYLKQCLRIRPDYIDAMMLLKQIYQ